jgi:hypothetical protein
LPIRRADIPQISSKVQSPELRTLHDLSLHVHLTQSATWQCTPETIEGWFTRAAVTMSFMWINTYQTRDGNPAKPLLELTAKTSSGAEFAGTVAPTSRNTPLELACDFGQVSPADDGSLCESRLYPCRKITQNANGMKTNWYTQRIGR